MKDPIDQDSLADPEFQSVLVSCLEKLERGEALDRDALLREYPQFAEPLVEFLDNQVLLQKMAAGIRDSINPDLKNRKDQNLEPTMDSASRPTDCSIGDQIRYIGDFEILKEIARGGMGIVFQARQQNLKRIVALKMILAGRLANASDVQRFHREARAAGRLKHPNIVPVHEIGEYEGRHYFTMDFVDGQSLSEIIRESALAPRRAAEIVRTTATAVEFAHQQGTLHRDLKPANVLLSKNDTPHITDFGLAKILDVVDDGSRAELTSTGQILGTPSYMSPEQAAGKSELVGPASDIYSLGAILYACLTGRAPFIADSPVDTLLQVMRHDPVPPRTLNPGVPRDLETICLKCLEKEPHRRYGTGQLLVDDLTRFLDLRPVLARPLNPMAKSWRWCRRNKVVATLLFLVGMSLLSGITTSSYFAIEASNRARAEADAKERQVELRHAAEAATAEAELSRDKAKESASIAQAKQAEAIAAQQAESAARQAESLHRQRAEQAVHQTAWHLYRAQLFPIRQAWDTQEFGQLSHLLETARSAADQFDFRGWEWAFFESEVNRRFITIAPATSKFSFVRWRQDGQMLALRREDGMIEIRGGENFELVRVLPGTNQTHFDWHPQKNWLAAATEQNRLEIWDVDDGSQLHSLQTPGSDSTTMNLRGVAWSHDGSRIALGGTRRIDIWSSAGTHQRTLVSPPSWVRALSWTPDGRRFGIAGVGYTAVVDIVADKVLWKASQSRVPVMDAKWDPAGKRLASAWEYPAYRVRIYDEQGHATDLPSTTHGPMGIAWNVDGTKIVSGNFDQGIYVWDIKSKSLDRELRLHTAAITSFDWNLPRNLGATVDVMGKVKIWNSQILPRSSVEFQVPLQGGRGWWIDWSAQKNLIACGNEKSVFVCDARTSRVIHTIKSTGRGFTAIDWHPSETLLAIQDHAGKVSVWDAETGKKVFERVGSSSDFCYSVAWSPNGRFLASGSGQKWRPETTGSVDVWRFPDGEKICSLDLQRNRGVVAWSPDSKRIAVASYRDRLVNVWDRKGQQRIATSPRLEGPIEKLAYSSDGKWIGAGSNIGTVAILDADTAERRTDLVGHSGPVRGLEWSPNGRRIATSGDDDTLRIWDATTAEEMIVLGVNSDLGFTATWSPDGGQIATFSRQGMVRIWGEPNMTLPLGTDVPLEGTLSIASSSISSESVPEAVPLPNLHTPPPAEYSSKLQKDENQRALQRDTSRWKVQLDPLNERTIDDGIEDIEDQHIKIARQIRRQIPAATAIDRKVFERIARGTEAPTAESFDSHTLTAELMILKLNPDKDSDGQFRYLTNEQPKLIKVAQEMYRPIGIGNLALLYRPVTMIHLNRITDFSVAGDGDKAKGSFGFTVPDLYEGKADFTASRTVDGWQIQQFHLPGVGIHIQRDPNGRWQLIDDNENASNPNR